MCCYGFSQGWKSLYNTAVYVLKKLIPSLFHEGFDVANVNGAISDEQQVR